MVLRANSDFSCCPILFCDISDILAQSAFAGDHYRLAVDERNDNCSILYTVRLNPVPRICAEVALPTAPATDFSEGNICDAPELQVLHLCHTEPPMCRSQCHTKLPTTVYSLLHKENHKFIGRQRMVFVVFAFYSLEQISGSPYVDSSITRCRICQHHLISYLEFRFFR